jgi:aspartyl-tRNA(Asn)/glutamyl-tRNA(Gln) amidotransferase subunit C
MTDEQLDKLSPELNNILGFIEQLSEVDTDNVKPLANVARKTLDLRSDVVSDGDCQDKVLANAPDSVEGYFAVNKVVE